MKKKNQIKYTLAPQTKFYDSVGVNWRPFAMHILYLISFILYQIKKIFLFFNVSQEKIDFLLVLMLGSNYPVRYSSLIRVVKKKK